MVREGLRDERVAAAPAQIESRARIRHERVRRSAEPRDHRVSGRIREVDEHAAIRRDRHPQQPALPSRRDHASEIEKIGRRGRSRPGSRGSDRPARRRTEPCGRRDPAGTTRATRSPMRRPGSEAVPPPSGWTRRSRPAEPADPADSSWQDPVTSIQPVLHPWDACRSFGSIASSSGCAAMWSLTIASAFATAAGSPVRNTSFAAMRAF